LLAIYKTTFRQSSHYTQTEQRCSVQLNNPNNPNNPNILNYLKTLAIANHRLIIVNHVKHTIFLATIATTLTLHAMFSFREERQKKLLPKVLGREGTTS
jgi:hypothetical protein